MPPEACSHQLTYYDTCLSHLVSVQEYLWKPGQVQGGQENNQTTSHSHSESFWTKPQVDTEFTEMKMHITEEETEKLAATEEVCGEERETLRAVPGEAAPTAAQEGSL